MIRKNLKKTNKPVGAGLVSAQNSQRITLNNVGSVCRATSKGITLISLVITIVILLIVAGVTISSLIENGLFEKAKEAKEKYDIAVKDEQNTLNSIAYEMQSSREELKYKYSQEETAVGTWVDGKTIYQRTYISSWVGTGDYKAYNIDENLKNINIISMEGTLKNISNGDLNVFPLCDGGNYILFLCHTPNTGIYGFGKFPNNEIRDVNITVKYTK